MGLFFYPSKTNRSSRFYSLFITFIGVAVCSVFLSISFGSSSYAADAAWSNSDRTQISYGEKTFSGPKTNDRDKLETYRFSGWTPSGGGQEGATYYINGTESIIWFPKGTSTGSAGTANYSTLVTTGTNAYTIESKDIKKISIGNDQTSSSLSVVKSIYRTSISDYVNKECQKSFDTNQERSQCRSLVTARFDTCFDGQVKDNSFTFNKDKPGDSIDIRELSGCIANNTDVGSVSQYNGIFSDAKNKANTDGAAAFNDAAPTGDPSDDSQASSCQIDGLGWIICPVLTVTAALVDGAYNFVEALLTVQPILTTGDSQSLYEAWKIMRNLANVAFVIAFLIIIFSQLTSFGVSNYGIKKLLPRIIMAAILVNVSYWICAIAVDASNILGTSLRGLLVNADNGGLAQPKGGVFNGETPWMNATGAILAGTVATGVILYATLSALLPALVAALVAIVTVFLVLTLRQALIILLIVIAPLAFVALLLPNTESWFKKWRTLLQTLLLMYPIIAVIFGASALASKIVMSSANSDNELYETAIQIMGALISILPLAITPVVMKTAGGLLNRFGGIVNNPNKGPLDKMRRGAEGIRDRRQETIKGRRIGRIGNFRNNRSGVIFGKEGSKRRRAISALTPYGSYQREQSHKDTMSALNASNEAQYIDSPEGAQGRMDAASAQNILKTAQAQLDSTRIKDPEHHNVDVELANVEARLKVDRMAVDTDALRSTAGQAAAIDLKTAQQTQTRAESSIEANYQAGKDRAVEMNILHNQAIAAQVKKGDSTAYEEIKSGNTPTDILYTDSASPEMLIEARDLHRESEISAQQTNSAARQQKQDFANLVINDNEIATRAGGVDAYGEQRASAQAKSVLVSAQNEAVKIEKDTMNDIDKGGLEAIRDDISGGTSMERRVAAASKLVDASSVGDVITQMNKYSQDLQNAKAAGNTEEVAVIHEMQQQFFSDAASAGRLPKSLTGQSKGALSTGTYELNFTHEVNEKFANGAYGGNMLASLSPHEVKAIAKIITDNPSAYQGTPRGDQLKASLEQYKTTALARGETPPPEIADAMDNIHGVL